MAEMVRDRRTGRMISKEQAIALAERQATFAPPPDGDEPATPVEPEPPFEPVKVWTGGPGSNQEKIFVPNGQSLKPGRDYAYHVRTKRQYDTLKKALGPRFWLSNVPEGEQRPKCDTCGWQTDSYQAAMWHTNQAHGRPQAGNR